MPRGNSNAWKQYGASFAELSAAHQEASSGTILASASQLAPTVPAGRTTKAPLKGSGTFQLQTTWSLGVPSTSTSSSEHGTTGRTRRTETLTQYQPPPPDYQRRMALRTDKSNFPKQDYPNDYKTVRQLDHGLHVIAGGRPSQPCFAKDSGRLLPNDIPPQYTTQQKTDFRGPSALEASKQPSAGASLPPSYTYNIITGGNALANNVFERFDGRDYRRHR